VQWLAVSVVLSVVLTIVLNVVIRAFPNASDRAARRLAELSVPRPDRSDSDRRTRVIVPWKAMIIGSLLLTIVLNLALWLR
jgi:hypothetical protein